MNTARSRCGSRCRRENACLFEFKAHFVDQRYKRKQMHIIEFVWKLCFSVTTICSCDKVFAVNVQCLINRCEQGYLKMAYSMIYS